jgi:hypothetical protein
VCADCLEHVLHRDVASLKPAGGDRPAVEDDARDVEPGERHDGAGNGLVAPDEHNQTVEAVAAGDELDRIGDHLAAHERRPHALGPHGDPVGDRDGVEFHRRAAAGPYPRLHVFGEGA